MDKTSMEMAMEALEDELKGLSEYKKMAETTTCLELKKILISIIKDEKVHAATLLQWINAAAKEILK